MRSQHQHNAFTLIELLVVIAIIAILAAILFPVFAQAREKARGITCVSNEKQLALGILMYIQDYDETFPQHWYCSGTGGNQNCASTGTLDTPFTPTAPESIMGWNEAIYPYVKSVQLFRCPDSPRAATLAVGADGSTFGNSDTAPTGATGYSINARLAGNVASLDHTQPTWNPLGEGALEFPATTILLSESSSNCSDGCSSSDENEWGWEGRHVDKLYGDGWDSGTTPNSAYVSTGKPPLTRHNGGANYAFSDGHVKFFQGGAMGLVNNPTSSDQVNAAAAVVADTKGQHATYCPNASCQYNTPVEGDQ